MPLFCVVGKACEVLHCLWLQILPAGIDGGGSDLVQRLFDGTNAVGYVEHFPPLPDGELWIYVSITSKMR